MFLIVFLASLVCCVALMKPMMAAAHRLGLVDRPDGRRKLHVLAVPLAGGPAILLAVACTLLVVFPCLAIFGTAPPADWSPYLGLLLGAFVICVVGVADDLGCLRGRQKLLGQIVAVLIVMASGVQIEQIRFLDRQLDLGVFSWAFTGFFLLGAINSLNLLDGMDGLLASIGLWVTVGMALLAIYCGQVHSGIIALALAGALLGFLFFNFPPASSFLGDSGSMLIGLAVGVLAIESSLKGPAIVALAAPTALLTLPILDTFAAILRRKLTGRSLYATDRAHLHHCLLRRGFSNHGVLLIVAGLCLIVVLGAVASMALQNELLAIASSLLVVGILMLSGLFGHAEVSLLYRRSISFLATLVRWRGPQRSRQTEFRLQGTLDWPELWGTITSCNESLNLKALQLDVSAPVIHEEYHARWHRDDVFDDDAPVWRAEIPLSAQQHVIGSLRVVGFQDQTPTWRKIAELGKLIQGFENAMDQLTHGVLERRPEPLSTEAAALSSRAM
jgi:UDP-GlcNAc:undecaprenyl-phosphate GlcNAc-1-phosphate transferase